MPPKPRSTPPKHSISAARAAARLEDYERDLSKKVLPPSDPVEAFYKPVDPQASAEDKANQQKAQDDAGEGTATK